MSWQQYVDSNLLGTGKVTRAAIIGQKGGLWAVSQGFNLSQQEQTQIISAFENPGTAQANGIHAGGVKFFCLKADDKVIYGKQGADGLCMVKTSQCILLGIYQSPIVPGEANKVIEGLGDYLISVGF